MTEPLRFFSAAAGIFAFFFLQRKINLKRDRRTSQFWMPLVALICSVAVIAFGTFVLWKFRGFFELVRDLKNGTLSYDPAAGGFITGAVTNAVSNVVNGAAQGGLSGAASAGASTVSALTGTAQSTLSGIAQTAGSALSGNGAAGTAQAGLGFTEILSRYGFNADVFRNIARALLVKFYSTGRMSRFLHLIGFDSFIFVLNTAFLAVYMVVRGIALPFMKKAWSNYDQIAEWSEEEYWYDQFYDKWFFKTDRSDFRRLVNALSYAAAAAAAVTTGLTWVLGFESEFWLMMLPTVAMLVLNEWYGYLAGYTKEQWEHNVSGEMAESRRLGHFFRVRDVLAKVFPSALLSFHTGAEYISHTGTTDILKELENSEDPIDQSVAEYFNTMGERREFNVDGIRACQQMLHHKSVVFFDPFYRDLGDYLIIPMISILMRGQNCLIVCGSNTISSDVKEWMTELISGYARMRSMWRVEELSRTTPACEIGIMSFRQLYDTEVLRNNTEFFAETQFVLLLEPGEMTATGQVGLSVIAELCNAYETPPIYCILNRHVNGLVDSMSHILRTEITKVVAEPLPRCIYTGMSWNADADYERQKFFSRETRFMGNGVELATTAVKNQIPKVTWYAEKKAPLMDIRWIAGQNYAPVTRYMNLPTHQNSLYEKLKFVPNLWSIPRSSEQFMIVEDEYLNFYAAMRTFFDRGRDHSFVNVLSENYLLRDYMRGNQDMFLTNPNAVPCIVPDYAKTLRNVLIQLLVRMSIHPVSEEEIRYELQLSGMDVGDPMAALEKLLKRYSSYDASIFAVHSEAGEGDTSIWHRTNYYEIPRDVYERNFAKSLANAYYIVEEEEKDREYLNARMFGHITQANLPGQFVVYEGRLYQVKSVSSKEHLVVLRRASSLYRDRIYYRQLRHYIFEQNGDPNVLYARKIADMEVRMIECSFRVETEGYLELTDYHDLKSARKIDLTGDPDFADYCRSYKNKTVMQIRLPGMDAGMRFTLALLLQEAFRSLFPESWDYIAVTVNRSAKAEGTEGALVYDLCGAPDDDCIYIIEDSEMDLGILDAVNRNLHQIFEIITDFLSWHDEEMRKEPEEAPQMGVVEMPADEPVTEDKDGKAKKRRKRLPKFLQMIIDFFKRLFHIGRKPSGDGTEAGAAGKTGEAGAQGTSPENGENTDEALSSARLRFAALLRAYAEARSGAAAEAGAAANGEKAPEKVDTGSAEETAETDSAPAAEPAEDTSEDSGDALPPYRNETEYQKGCYLKYGYDAFPEGLRVAELLGFLKQSGYSDNALMQARTKVLTEPEEVEAAAHCDLCGKPLTGASYEELRDGRIRCNDCSATAINTEEEFREIFFRVLELMQSVYGISFHVPITVRMVDAAEVAKGSGAVFKPTADFDARVLGYAQRKGDNFAIIIENGAPRLAAMNTMAHELTHIWQYLNWKDADIVRQYGSQSNRLMVYEGMACWSSIQLMYQLGEFNYAFDQEWITSHRDDVYGKGFNLYCEKYPLMKSIGTLSFSPFRQNPPL